MVPTPEFPGIAPGRQRFRTRTPYDRCSLGVDRVPPWPPSHAIRSSRISLSARIRTPPPVASVRAALPRQSSHWQKERQDLCPSRGPVSGPVAVTGADQHTFAVVPRVLVASICGVSTAGDRDDGSRSLQALPAFSGKRPNVIITVFSLCGVLPRKPSLRRLRRNQPNPRLPDEPSSRRKVRSRTWQPSTPCSTTLGERKASTSPFAFQGKRKTPFRLSSSRKGQGAPAG